MEIAAALSSMNAALDILKGLRAVDKAYDQALLRAQIVELMGNVTDAKAQLLEALEEVAGLEKEMARLRSALQTNATLLPGEGGYKWQDVGDGSALGFPVCPSCIEIDGRQVQLKQHGPWHQARCPVCKNDFSPVPELLPRDGSGGQITRAEHLRREQEAQRARDEALMNREPWVRL